MKIIKAKQMRLHSKSGIYLLVLTLLIIISSCSDKAPVNYSEYIKWIDNTDNGLVSKRSSNGLDVRVKYIS